MTSEDAIAFVRAHGVVLASAKGPVPRLTEAIADGPIKGSWWAHAKSRHIYVILQAVSDCDEVLVCRLVDGKVTLVHRRLWPALVRVAHRFPAQRIAQVREEHTASGHHESRAVAFPNWVPDDVKEHAKLIGEEDALAALGAWALDPPAIKMRRKASLP